MEREKFELKDFEIESFVTELSEAEKAKIRGGIDGSDYSTEEHTGGMKCCHCDEPPALL